ncbi:MAG: hypothetical protein ACKO6A_01050 [Bacteroidota bacterium]
MKIVKETMDENFLQSPMPFINRLRAWIYGPNSPKLFVKIGYGINSLIALIFVSWHLLGFTAVFFRKFVFAKKQIAVDEIIQSNATKMGYTFEELIRYLQIHHLISAGLWILILWVLVLFWRGSKKIYLYLLFLLLAYFIQGIYFFGWRFITNELTLFDVVLMIVFSLVIVVDGLIQLFFSKAEIQNDIYDVVE